MCGIVAAVSSRNIVPILIEGLRRLEYRGYDSCGVALHQDGELRRARSTARVAELAANVDADHLQGGTGIAHTRWATHGAPVVNNAHPHFSHGPRVAVADSGEASGIAAAGRVGLVHNGIIENHDELRAELQAAGYVFVTQTDTEVIAHLVDHLYDGDLLEAVQRAVPQAARRLRHRRVLPRRAAPRGRRAPGLAADPRRGHRARRERDLPRLRRDGARRRHRPDRLPRRRRRRRHPARQALDRPCRRRRHLAQRRAAGEDGGGAQRRRRARPLPALHAEGDLRAAAGHRRHARRRARRLARAVRRRRAIASSRTSSRC